MAPTTMWQFSATMASDSRIVLPFRDVLPIVLAVKEPLHLQTGQSDFPSQCKNGPIEDDVQAGSLLNPGP
jgi:hypothetical protein